MIRYSLGEAATLLGAQLRGPAEVRFTGLSTDSRAADNAGTLFVALSGPNFDAHDFVAAAAAQGVAAALVARWVDSPLPQLKVDLPLAALGQLASAWRRRFTGRLIALTGSNGKTTSKEMLVAVLGQAGSVLATAGNLNNEIGVPLTLARLADHDFAVIEMGANHPNEIAYLTGLARPDVALITNAGPAHLEGFGDLAGVACAKGEIYQGLGPDGIAVVNADDRFASYWRSLLAERRVIDFSLRTGHGADTAAQLVGEPAGDSVMHIRLNLFATGDVVAVRLALPGRHNFYNALAAAACATAVEVSPAQIKAGLEQMRPVAGRLQSRPGPFGSSLIDDSYNANPGSLAAALAVLTAAAPAWLVLGDMAELGNQSKALHREAGRMAREQGVERLYCLGNHSRLSSAEFGPGAASFDTVEALCAALLNDLRDAPKPPRVLVKGSRSMRMERVTAALRKTATASTRPAAGAEN